LDRTAIVLAGGSSTRFGEDKGVLELGNKPLLRHVTDAVSSIVDEIIVVTNSRERIAKYSKVVGTKVDFALDICESEGPLIGALTGFEKTHGKYALLLPVDTPFVSREVINLLFDLCPNRSAVIPKWPNEQIEPLHAVYQTRIAMEAAKQAVNEGKLNLRAMIEKMRFVRYVSTLVIQQLDPNLKGFFNINTPLDLKKANSMLKTKRNSIG
jgi:molybdopterin-guanine dinucleotide biosynthesis protein A